MIGPRELPIMYSLNIGFFIIGVSIYTYEMINGDFDPFLYIWCFTELLNSFFLIPYYFVISQTIFKELIVLNKKHESLKEIYNP